MLRFAGSVTHAAFLRRGFSRNTICCRFFANVASNVEDLFGTNNHCFVTNIGFGTGVLGHLSEASIVCTHGNTLIHATTNSKYNAVASSAFLPLTVDYRSRQYAHGSIPKLRSRRERHGTEEEVLVARVIDRTIRPLFPDGYINEVQITVTNHSNDGISDPVPLCVNAASFALLRSKQPWFGPIGCVRVGCINGRLKVNPTLAEMEESTLDFLYAGTRDRVLM
jgi:polyribonucleotide nucleotidyltransferase